jgi:hypothetical protein
LNIFALVEKAANDHGKVVGKLRLLFGDQELISTNMDIDFQGKARARAVATIQGIVFEKPGTLQAELRIGRTVGKWAAQVTTLAPPMIAAPMKGTISSSEKNVRAKKIGRRSKKAAKRRLAKR